MFIDPKGNKICEVAVRHGFLTQELAQKCLELQAKDTASGLSRKMGSYLIEIGELNKSDLKRLLEILREQKKNPADKTGHTQSKKRTKVVQTKNCPHCKEIILSDSLTCGHCEKTIGPDYEEESDTYLSKKKKKAPPKEWPVFKVGCLALVMALTAFVFFNASRIKSYVAQFIPKNQNTDPSREGGSLTDPDSPNRHKAFDLVEKLQKQLDRDIDTKKDSLRSGDLKQLLNEDISSKPRRPKQSKPEEDQKESNDSHRK